MPRTLVLLSPHDPAAVPAAAVPVLRAAAAVHADHTVPAPLRTELDALCWAAGEPFEVLLSTDAGHPEAASVDRVVAAPAPDPLLAAVAVMDRLRSPGGCPWDAEQTHTSLLQYLVEECYELHQAIEDAADPTADGDRAEVREELGDVLLQVLFHARIAAEHPTEPFTVQDVAADLVAKLVGRHPHVFGTGRDGGPREVVATAERQEQRWEQLKRAEKSRDSSVDGVPLGQPAVALAAKLTSRTARAGLPAELLPAGHGVGERLFGTAAAAKLAGFDPEAELRTAARRFADDVRAAERSAAAAGADQHTLDADTWRAHWPTAPRGQQGHLPDPAGSGRPPS